MNRIDQFRLGVLAALLVGTRAGGDSVKPGADRWTTSFASFPYVAVAQPAPSLVLERQDFEQLQRCKSVIGTPMRLGDQVYSHGLGTHSTSSICVLSPVGIRRLTAVIGVDRNERTGGGQGSVEFAVQVGEREIYRSGLLRGGDKALVVSLALEGATEVRLRATDGGDGPACDHADWADARIELADGRQVWLDELPEPEPSPCYAYPFSFKYRGVDIAEQLPGWKRSDSPPSAVEGVTRRLTTWEEPAGGLSVSLSTVVFDRRGAVEWLLSLANNGARDTGIVEDVQALDLSLATPALAAGAVRLHRMTGGIPAPDQFEPSVVSVSAGHRAALGARSGRSSTHDMPFFGIEMGRRAAVVAVGWSGCWSATVEAAGPRLTRIRAGLESTRFVLHPGEHVRMPRGLVLQCDGDLADAGNRFRALLLEHYAAHWKGPERLPVLFSNTCFTRGGGWLNECNAANQVSLIDAYAPLGLEAVVTDAGWFEGGWPAGAGNWYPRKDAYPDGMAPVAEAARRHGMVYGLWYEPERVVSGTDVHRLHPEWCLGAVNGAQDTYLLNFGLPEVQQYFFNIVAGFMKLPGFRFYRQDFNMDPLPYWRHNDAPDRQGMTELKYIEGLYAYWDRLATTWPDSLREECASGGHRMDLETLMRFQIHQKTDFWFNNEVDQASIWSLSRFVPNNTFVAPIDRLDDYKFWSVAPTSLCIGWIADDPGFRTAQARRLLARYQALRKYFTGDFYPLTPYSRGDHEWIAYQFHRPDLDAGVVLAFRRGASIYSAAELPMRGVAKGRSYLFKREGRRDAVRLTGESLLKGMPVTIDKRHDCAVITYHGSPR